MSEGREDANWDTAQATHREIQEEILHSRNLELFDDVERLLPPGKLPDCVEQEMPVDPWDPSDLKKARKLFSPKRASKTKADKPVQRGHEIPEGGSVGFKSVAQLLKESGKSIGKGKTAVKRTLSLEEALDAIDDEDEPAPPRHATKIGGRGGKRNREPSPIASASSGGEADEQALEALFETRANGAAPRKSAATKAAPAAKRQKPAAKESLSKTKSEEQLRREAQEKQAAALEQSALDFFAMSPPVRKRLLTPESSPPASSPPPAVGGPSRRRAASTSPEAESPPHVKKRSTKVARGRATPSPITDESLCQAPPPPLFTPDPAPSTRRYQAPPSPITDESIDQHAPPLFTPDAPAQPKAKLTPRTAALAGFSQLDPVDLSWNGDDLEDGSEAGGGIISSPVVQTRAARQTAAPAARGRTRTLGLSRARPMPREGEMPPPPVPPIRTSSPPSSDRAAPPARARARSRRDSAERVAVSPLVGLGRNRRNGDGPRAEPAAARRRKRPPTHVQDMVSTLDQLRMLRSDDQLDLDAEVSGTDSSDEASSSADVESESDRQFANDFQPTQAPKGYNQRSIYLQGQSTQAAAKLGLAFRPMGNKEAFFAKARRPVWISDDESEGGGAPGGAGPSSENEYELGSFVCPDDDVDFACKSRKAYNQDRSG